MLTINARRTIGLARKSMQEAIHHRKYPLRAIQPNKDIVACYTAAIAVNFTDWMGKTLPWARHEKSRLALTDNIRCESVDDHVGMLLEFARSCQAFPQEFHFNRVEEEVQEVRRLFKNPQTAGLSGVALMAILENTSEIFIPVLAKIATRLGSKNLRYTQIHGVADIEHSRAFTEAFEAELTMGYSFEEQEVFAVGTRSVVHNLFCAIFR